MRSRRGMFFIGVLFLAVVVAMFATAALALAPASLQRSVHLAKRQAAERAVRTGTDYAIARIRATPGGLWQARDAQVLQFQGMTVREGDGQVEGWVREGEHWSRFRMTFNFQDGAGGQDGLGDPAQPFSPPVGLSFNNLPRNVEAAIRPTTSSGAVDQQAGPRFQLPPHCLLLSIEGACGQAQASGVAPVGFYGTPSRFRVETVVQLSNPALANLDSVASSAGDLRFQVRAGQRVHFEAVGGAQARLRTRSSLAVTDHSGQGGELFSPSGEIRTPGDGNNVGSTAVAASIARQNENAGDGFYSIGFDSTPQTGGDAITLAAGVYEVDLVNGQPVVKRYEMTYADYKAQRLAGTLTGGTDVVLDPAIQLNVLPRPSGDIVEVHFSKDTNIQAGTLDNFAIVPAKGAFQETDVPPQLQAQPLQHAAVEYLVELSNRIQAEMETANSRVINGDVATLTGVSMTTRFHNLLSSYGGGSSGNVNTGGVSVAYNPTGIPVVNNFGVPWDGLAEGQYQYGSLQLAQHFWSNLNPDRAMALQSFVGGPVPAGFGDSTPPDVGFGGGGGNDPTPVPPNENESSGLSVQELKVRLEGQSDGSSVTLRAPGETILAGMLEGNGGAVVSAGNLSLLGNGVDLAAASDAENGINLYSCGDILIDGFAFDDSGSRYNDIKLQGVMYSWGDIIVNAGRANSSLAWGGFDLRGAMVAFGMDPSASGVPSPKNIQITARRARLTFDPAYLSNLVEEPITPESRFLVRAYHQR